MIAKYANDTPQKVSMGYRALNQLRTATNVPPSPLAGLPEGLAPSGREVDPRLWSLSKLLLTVMSLDDDLAQTVLAEIILSANRTGVDASQGRLGFDPTVFRAAMSRKPVSADDAAAALTDPLRRIVAQAVINKWKVDNLIKAQQIKPKADSKVTLNR